MSEYITKTYLKDFLMYILPMYKEKLDSFRRIMEAMELYRIKGVEDRALPDREVEGITFEERNKAHMLMEAGLENILLAKIFARLLAAARGSSDKTVMIAIDWVSDTVSDDTLHPEDKFYYDRAMAAWEDNSGPGCTTNGGGDMITRKKELLWKAGKPLKLLEN